MTNDHTQPTDAERNRFEFIRDGQCIGCPNPVPEGERECDDCRRDRLVATGAVCAFCNAPQPPPVARHVVMCAECREWNPQPIEFEGYAPGFRLRDDQAVVVGVDADGHRFPVLARIDASFRGPLYWPIARLFEGEPDRVEPFEDFEGQDVPLVRTDGRVQPTMASGLWYPPNPKPGDVARQLVQVRQATGSTLG